MTPQESPIATYFRANVLDQDSAPQADVASRAEEGEWSQAGIPSTRREFLKLGALASGATVGIAFGVREVIKQGIEVNKMNKADMRRLAIAGDVNDTLDYYYDPEGHSAKYTPHDLRAMHHDLTLLIESLTKVSMVEGDKKEEETRKESILYKNGRELVSKEYEADRVLRLGHNEQLDEINLRLEWVTECLKNVDNPGLAEEVIVPILLTEGRAHIVAGDLHAMRGDVLSAFKAYNHANTCALRMQGKSTPEERDEFSTWQGRVDQKDFKEKHFDAVMKQFDEMKLSTRADADTQIDGEDLTLLSPTTN